MDRINSNQLRDSKHETQNELNNYSLNAVEIEKLFADFSRNSPVSFVIIRIDARGGKPRHQIIAANKAAERIVENETDSSCVTDISSILADDKISEFQSAIERVNISGKANDFGEVYLHGGQNREGWYHVRMIPLRPNFAGVSFFPTTYQRKMESALRESEERWQLVVSASGDGIWDWNLVSDSIFYSDRWFDITGHDRKGISNHLKNLESFIHPDDLTKVRRRLEGHLNRVISSFAVEYRFKTGKNGYKWVRENAQAVFDDDGKPIRMAGSISDIHTRKQAEEQLRREQILLRTLIDNIPDAVYVKDTECRKVISNLADVHNMHFESEHQVLGKNDFELFPKELAEGFYADDMRVIRNAEPVLNREEYVIDEVGGKKWLNTTKLPLRDEKGSIVGLVGIGRDITPFKNAEELLRASEHRFRLISENVVDTITVLDLDYICRYASLSYQRDGIDPKTFLGQDFMSCVHPDDIENVRGIFTEVTNKYEHRETSFRFHRGNGEWRIKEASINALLSDDGVEILIVMRDITERVAREEERIALQEELRKRNAELERIIEDMKQMQKGLIQSEKLASIGQLVAGIAHEINNPLAFVSSNLNRFDEYFQEYVLLDKEWREMSQMLEKDPGCRNAVMAIRRREGEIDIDSMIDDFNILMKHTRDGAERIKRIVEQLRGFTHLSDTTMAEADLNSALDDTLSIVWNEIKYKAEVKKEYGAIPPVVCNLGEIKQVFVNLLVNAAQAIKEKGEITIGTKVKDSHVFVDIQDTGSGIPSELVTRIFDPFFTTKPVGKGTGLGLWVSATIIEKHGGRIDVESEVGKGTKMTIVLPISGNLQ